MRTTRVYFEPHFLVKLRTAGFSTIGSRLIRLRLLHVSHQNNSPILTLKTRAEGSPVKTRCYSYASRHRRQIEVRVLRKAS